MPALAHLALPLPIACLLSNACLLPNAAHSTTTINKSIQSKHDSRCINSSDDFEASILCSGLHSPSYLPTACNSSTIPLILRQLQASPRGKIIRHHTSDRSISICFFRINSRGHHHHEHGFAAAREPCYSKLCGASRLGGCDLCELHASTAARVFFPRPAQFGISDFEELMIPTPDHQSLHAFYVRAANKRHSKNTTILMFHGNAGNIGFRLPIAKVLSEMGYGILMLEYRGYGFSTGSPDEQGLMIDAQTGLDYLRERVETADNSIIIYGQSLGGAVSIQLVAKNQHDGSITGLILENTFQSMRKLIPSILPPARYIAGLCHQTWQSEIYIPTITEVPVLFLSGLRDEIVPPHHMRHLYVICQSPTKIWHPLPSGDHNSSVSEPGYFEAISSFIENLNPRKLEQGY